MKATKTDLTTAVAKPRRDPGREHQLVGKHSARCKAAKHEDWQHGLYGCAVGPQGEGHCDCEAHWVEKPPATRFGQ